MEGKQSEHKAEPDPSTKGTTLALGCTLAPPWYAVTFFLHCDSLCT